MTTNKWILLLIVLEIILHCGEIAFDMAQHIHFYDLIFKRRYIHGYFIWHFTFLKIADPENLEFKKLRKTMRSMIANLFTKVSQTIRQTSYYHSRLYIMKQVCDLD